MRKVATMPVYYAHEDDNGGRRCPIDRRQFSYAAHIPERRVASDRRSEKDRRILGKQSQGRGPSNAWLSNRVIRFPASNVRG